MKISLNEIRTFNERYKTCGDIAPEGIDKLVEKIGAQLGGVDEVIDLGKKYLGIIVAKVASCQPHPNADKLKLCKIDDGGVAKDVKRDENGHVQVVCGAPNVREGLLVAWLPPGSTVPSTYNDKSPLLLEAKEIRGETSNGMLASTKELAISDDHSEIFEINPDYPVPQGKRINDKATKKVNGERLKVQPGDDFAKLYGLDDYIIDIENKMFTHRPDLFGMLGISRELAGIQGMPFKSPDWYLAPSAQQLVISNKQQAELPLEVHNEVPELVPRFMAITMSDVKVGPSPLWLQIFLSKMGQKPINNVVDYTNYYMLLTAQPLHAYDYDKVKARSDKDATIVVRYPKKNEKLKLLNGKEVEPRSEAIMIATDKELIGVGGVMGGADTEVDENTTNIILECANFDMYSIRRTSMEHGLFTDAVTRFTKGQSPLQNPAVLAKIVDEIEKYAGGKIACEQIDIYDCDKLNLSSDGWIDDEIHTTNEFINARLGLSLSSQEIIALLKNVEFGSDMVNDGFKLYAPFWRTDIEIPEDIVEEVGRLYGYDKLPLDLPRRTIVPVGPDGMLQLKKKLRRQLKLQGANETLTYSFVNNDLFGKVGQDPHQAFKLANALSPDLQYYRLSLLPSLLGLVHPNVKAGFESFALFEIGKTHRKEARIESHEARESGLPKELETLALAFTDSNKAAGAPYYHAKRYLDALAHSLGLELNYYPVARDPDLPMLKPFDLDRSAFVAVKDSKGMLGVIGEFNAATRKQLKLPRFSSGFEVGLKELLFVTQNANAIHYQPLSRYPGTWQDICVQVSPKIAYKDVYQTVREALVSAPFDSSVEPVDIYQPDSGEYKNITLRVSLTSHDHTITSDETKVAMSAITERTVSQLQAKII